MSARKDILVIDDDRDLVETLRIVLESKNYEVRAAYDGKEGFHRIEEKLPENSYKMGSYFLEELRKSESPYVKEYRGKGLWIGIELKESAGGARRFCEKLQQEHHILCKETHHHIIRIAPPLIITKEEIDWALEGFKAVLTA